MMFFFKMSSGIVFSLVLFGPKFHCAFAVLMGIHYTEAQNQGNVLTLEKTFALIDSIPHRVTGFNKNCNGVFCPLVELVINTKKTNTRRPLMTLGSCTVVPGDFSLPVMF